MITAKGLSDAEQPAIVLAVGFTGLFDLAAELLRLRDITHGQSATPSGPDA